MFSTFEVGGVGRERKKEKRETFNHGLRGGDGALRFR